ncbi:PepSY domain-containing protein [Carboxylicivirga mesophila]|uniref:PepSY domain-containing protein n=1 Tax=Carboxylicivirga mesophila TaxID=1166478 RepID=A0ABS5K9M9_9BACT|nr:PepSY domain-containing protein [Carboxylicivirga mesophila]MBS2211719.1 PepSY domain-containing protein [Carboxylicivirga mesophila]
MKFWRKYHKWAGIILCFFLILFSFSGILLNHRQAISSIDIPRQYLSESYQYDNWNNAAIKGSIKLDSTQSIFFGNIGCWALSSATNEWTDFNQGFDKGIDKRKVTSMLLTNNQRLFAGTLFGLYEFCNNRWNYISLDIENEHITDLIEHKQQLLVLTRSELAKFDLTSNSYQFMQLPAPNDFDGKSSLFKTIWLLHSGEVLGFSGKIIVDIIAIIIIFLSVTGIIWFLSPSLIKQRKKRQRSASKHKQLFRFSVKWHNKIGYYAVILLVFTTFTGMFLRPPLLIAIANAQVKSIPFTVLDSPNAWYDQLRAIRYNQKYDVFFVSTSKGMYALTADFAEMVKVPNQPPVSVMGINVFEEKSEEHYLIGSFSGLYLWNPFDNSCFNYITRQPHKANTGMSRPIGTHMATGYYQDGPREVYFDYNSGAQMLTQGSYFYPMQESIKNAAPVSLWNAALEIHTGRIFQDLIGSFYILIVPIIGLTTIALLLSGLWIYIKKFNN